MTYAPACQSRFTRPVFLWALVALLTDLLVEWLPSHGLYPQVPRPLTLLPLVPVTLFWVSLVRTILKMDELQKRIWLDSVFIAFMATLALTFVFAGLDRIGIHRTPADDIGSYMMLFWGGAYVFCASRYR